MSWLWGVSRAKSPQNGDQNQQQQQTDLRGQRAAQLAALEKNTPGIALKSTDASLYEITMAAPPDGRAVVLRIFLPTRFPEERPGTMNTVGFCRFSNVLTAAGCADSGCASLLQYELMHLRLRSYPEPATKLHACSYQALPTVLYTLCLLQCCNCSTK
jgi:hypothetical protein